MLNRVPAYLLSRYSSCPCLVFRRWTSTTSKVPVSSYRKTLNLPKTSFPLSMKDGLSAKREIEIQKVCGFSELYSWQREQNQDQEFVLHDGPPYANGSPHVGHALNKILKDITLRYKLLCGYKVHYVPGWDCHGMPIEQKALAEVRMDHTIMDPLDIRAKAQSFAKKTIKTQSAAFQRWGVMADWKKNCYYTYTRKYVASQLDVFYRMYEKGLIYRDYMPVYWSPSSRTALAEAELEYNDQHKSTAVHVRFPITNLPQCLQQQLGGADVRCWAVIWTTTPWTLPANHAICYGPGIKYQMLRSAKTGDVYIVGAEFGEGFGQMMPGDPLEVITTFNGSDLAGATYSHPLIDNSKMPLLPGNHVTVAKGTGLVHTAPAHGPEDFQVARHHSLPMDCHVDEDGRYTAELGPELAGKSVLTEGNQAVMALLRDHILHEEEFEHSYPYDWRTKEPVILRACKQWFVNTSQVKEAAIKCLEDVDIIPHSSGQGMLAQLDRRTYWCISRQRAWGVPIPIFYHQSTDDPLITRASIEHIKAQVLEHGADSWWRMPTEQLLPPSVIEQSGFDASATYTKCMDVLDIWFDSGASWAAVLDDKIADVYLEGLDQFGGWFQSSLLTSVALRGHAPYRSLVVHGFAMDEDGRKMSKSEGNVVDPHTIINGGKNRTVEPAYGVDVMRWWCAHSGFDPKVNIGSSILQHCHEQVFRVRKALRYLMGNLSDFDHAVHQVAYASLLRQDQYMLHQLLGFCEQVTMAYEEYNYSRVTQLLEKFVSSQVSGYHAHITKDRLYCNLSTSHERRSGQTVQYLLLDALLKVIAPIVPHLAEEAHMFHPFRAESESVFMKKWFRADPSWFSPSLKETFDIVFAMRDTFNTAIAADNPVLFDVVVCAKPTLYEKIKVLQEEQTSSVSALAETFQCSSTSLLAQVPFVIPDESQLAEGHCTISQPDGSKTEHKYLLVILPPEKALCERCRRHTAEKQGELCDRCTEVVAN